MQDKLVKIQRELKAPKAQFNSFGKYNYRSCEDIVEAVKPLLHAEDLILLISDEVVCVGNKNYVKATATVSGKTYNSHAYVCEISKYLKGETILKEMPNCTCDFKEESSSISVTAFAREADAQKGMNEAQITGSASSYARKYALNGLFAIDDTKDADATNDHGHSKPQEYPAAAQGVDDLPVITRR